MRIVTFKIPKELLQQVDNIVDDGLYPSRSAMIRESLRNKVQKYRYKEE